MTRLLSVSIENFRGISRSLNLEFPREERGLVRPFLILGSNGSGKSSICDAIEFAARGSVSRRYQNGEKDRRELRNLMSRGAPKVELVLSTGETIVRGRGAGKHGGLSHEAFSKAPLIIRRKSVESFWSAEESNRLEIFWDYFKPRRSEWRSPVEQDIIDAFNENRKYLDKDWRSYLEFTKATRAPEPPRSIEVFERHLERRRRSPRFRRMSKDDLIYFDNLVHDLRYSLEREFELRPRAIQAEAKPIIDYELLREILEESASRVARLFRDISRADWIDEVLLTPIGTSGLSTKLRLPNGRMVDPTDILSEANLDLLALLIHVEMQVAASSRGQARVLVLDDVFQSVDAPMRQRAMRTLISELQEWQLIITLHDRLWMEILARICTDFMRVKPNFIELRSATMGEGPTVFKSGMGILRDLHFVLDNGGSPVLLVGACGRALEALVDQLSIALKCKIVRVKDDKYSIGDLLPAVSKVLENNVDPDLRLAAEKVKYAQFSRNIFGAHFHAEGDLISHEEALDVVDSVIQLAEASVCGRCGNVMGGVLANGRRGDLLSGEWRFWCEKDKEGQSYA